MYWCFGEFVEVLLLYVCVVVVLSGFGEVLWVIEVVLVCKCGSALIFVVLHDLAFVGCVLVLVVVYVVVDDGVVGGVVVDMLFGMIDAVVAIVACWWPCGDEIGCCVVFYLVIVEVARWVGAKVLGLIDVVCSVGFNLNVDCVGIMYGGCLLGDLSLFVQLVVLIVGDWIVLVRAMLEVVAWVGVDFDLVDVIDVDDARWLRVCLLFDWLERFVRFDVELVLVVMVLLLLLRGDVVEWLFDVFV